MIQRENIPGNTRDIVPIKTVRDGVVVLEDGTLVGIVLATSVNLALKSFEEQKATIESFKAFLNVLDFPIQINVQSRKMDIEPYIEILEERMNQETNDLIKLQIMEYINFIKNFTTNVNIMDKHFFIVVSYKPIKTSEELGFFAKLFGSKKESDILDFSKTFEEAKIQLEQRVDLITAGIRRTGVKTKLLDSEAVLELFESIYKPDIKI